MDEAAGDGAHDVTTPVVQVVRVDHVGIAVPDLDDAADFFATVFGLSTYHRERNADQAVDEAMLTPSPQDPSTGVVQLLAPAGQDSVIGRFLDRRGPGLQQLALQVTDVDEAADALRRRGLRVIYDTARTGTAGTRVNFVHPGDAFGVLVELVEVRGVP